MIDAVSAVILISAGAEWRALFPELAAGLPGCTAVASSPYGEWFEAQVNNRKVIFLHGGWGKVAAAASAEYAISRWQPERILNLGTCGGFAGLAEPGEIFLAEETVIYDIIEQMGDQQEAIRHYSAHPRLDGLPEKLPFPLRRVRLISADRDILPAQIPELIGKFGAVAADWESGAIAWVAGRHNLPCIILRGVTDVVSTTGGEAYGDIEVFRSRAREIMRKLISALPDLI